MQGILIGVVAAYVVVVTILGPECVTLLLLLDGGGADKNDDA